MTLIPRGNFYDLDKFFEQFWGPVRSEGGESPAGDFFAPRVDITERNEHYEITAELPGVKKENLNITLEDGVLSIEAETRQEEKQQQGDKIIRQERRYGKYRRSFNLGDSVHEEDISASFEDGILKVSAPKAREVAPKQRRIEIQ